MDLADVVAAWNLLLVPAMDAIASFPTLPHSLATPASHAAPAGPATARPSLVEGVFAFIGWTLLLAFVIPLLSFIPAGWSGSAQAGGAIGCLFSLAALALLLAWPAVRHRVRALELPGMARGGLRQLAPLLAVAGLYGGLGLWADGLPTALGLGYVVALSAMAGATEEVWRALALRALGGRMRPWLAVMATSLIFGALHLAAFSTISLAHAVAAALIGAAFGVAILRGVPVAVAAAVHAAYDVILLLTLDGTYYEARRAAEAQRITATDLLLVAPLVLAAVLSVLLGVRALGRARGAGA